MATTTGAVTTMSNQAIMDEVADHQVEIDRRLGRQVELMGELERRRGFEDEGATSLDTWASERLGLSPATARARSGVATRLWDLPHLADGLTSGELTFDKVAAVLPVATPENDADLRRTARHCSVRQLRDLATSRRRPPSGPADHEARFLRFHDEHHTISAKLPAEAYAEVRTILDQAAKALPSDGQTPWDQRRCDAMLLLLRGRTTATGGEPPYTVVVHAPLSTILPSAGAGAGADLSDVGGELERHGLLDVGTVRRIACDATLVLALDDDVGHTMYEGRSKRFPTPTQRREVMRRDRHCRFPGCTNATFTNTHHLRLWQPDGRTDLPNLVLLCEHHHHTIHKNAWHVDGDANDVLTFVGPTGRRQLSRPSPGWTSDQTRSSSSILMALPRRIL